MVLLLTAIKPETSTEIDLCSISQTHEGITESIYLRHCQLLAVEIDPCGQIHLRHSSICANGDGEVIIFEYD
jgi:hypothetical protein